MAGSHRAKPTRRGRTSAVPSRAIAVAVIVALIPATWLTAQRLFDSSAAPSDHSTDLPIPPVSPRASKTPTTAGPSSPGPSTSPAALAKVTPDAPRRIQSGTLINSGFDNAVSTIEAASSTEVARLESRGSPGSPGPDTVYVIGKVLSDGESAFASLPQLAVGSTVSIQTDSGTLTYTVSASALKAESGLSQDPLFTARAPGRLVLVGIRYAASGDRLRDALVITAQLSGAERS